LVHELSLVLLLLLLALFD